ncbi:hypothetical protein [Gottfriedia acidiceleris]|uniref:hypothetical protein n=1 Tax=Gottfriedia acidiceleris TaxID=371036 RepID=UPI00101C550B|nr:hypothetical protein [Gottfriedia acidiceleris]
MVANVEQYSSQLSAKIWGHRFTDGQRGPEYVLEFLNVLVGANYNLDSPSYSRRKAIGLRQFIFEGVKEGSKRDIVKLDDSKKKNLYEKIQDPEKVEVIREFFRNLEVPLVDGRGKEADRSWFARTLYPLHECLLFFEVRKKGNSIGYERNFFSRGGELYYLMLSYGTEGHPKLRSSIENKLKVLLKKNVSLEKIVDSICKVLGDEEKEKDEYPLKVSGDVEAAPSLPKDTHNNPLFYSFAKELNQLMDINVDIYEMFRLLTSLINFQIMRYIYDRAKNEKSENILFFFDCLDGQVNQILNISSNTFKNNELLIKNKFEDYFKDIFKSKIGEIENINDNLEIWKKDPENFLEFMGLSKLRTRKQPVIKTLKQCKDYNDVMTKLFNTVKEVVSDQLKRHQLSIVRILARDGGIGNYKTGTNYRYSMTDTFLQTLVFSNVEPNCSIEFSDFLEKIYELYGFVIGVKQARESEIYENSRLNIRYFQKNELALREKLKKNGLLVEYSDATAMIKNPYDASESVVIS